MRCNGFHGRHWGRAIRRGFWRPIPGKAASGSGLHAVGLRICATAGFPAVIGEDRIFPPEPGATSGRQRVEGSFDDLLERAGIKDFRFHDLRHTFASWFMMKGGDLYELAKILGHSNIKMTERYAKLARHHIARTGSTAREIWKLMEQQTCDKTNIG
jgi:integrase